MKSLINILESILDQDAGITDVSVVQSMFDSKKLKITLNASTGRFDVVGGITIRTPEQAQVPWGNINGIFGVCDITINASNMPDSACGINFTRASLNADTNKTIKLDTFGKTLDNSLYNGEVSIYGLKVSGKGMVTFDSTDTNRKQLFRKATSVSAERLSSASARKLAFVGFDNVPATLLNNVARANAKASGQIAKDRTISDISVFNLFKNCKSNKVKEAAGNKILDKEWPAMMKALEDAVLDGSEVAKYKGKAGSKLVVVRGVTKNDPSTWADAVYCSLALIDVLGGRMCNQYEGHWVGNYTHPALEWRTTTNDGIKLTQAACLLSSSRLGKSDIDYNLTKSNGYRVITVSNDVFDTLKKWML